MIAAATFSEELHHMPADDRRRLISVIRAVGLPDRIPAGLDIGDILSRIARDKKKTRDTVNFVLLKKLGIPLVNGGIPKETIQRTLEAMRP
jgi:3-dehydroquinate synthetase